ncbi:hypothetical protein [Weissella hellenica]|uniref:Uncharacterized protein n=1 Tax=Weissella hellenica TaxID=46256 RepID=A0A4Y4G412_WEIHE|nr:hypothetical protein [Weissella hellenica]NKY67573.1 hypothetical protein [Weissella hellenica]GED36547.1 hypothetical protein WHE01_14510 [Weissella hellenica]SCC08424.1 hypothetical protein GA0061075_1154 [Weissella hellenica]
MSEIKTSHHHKSHGCAGIRHLLKNTRDIPDHLVEQLVRALENTLTCHPEIFVGQVYDSCVYRIGCGDIYTETKLLFATPDVRNKFASSFEAACCHVGFTVHRSY